MDRHTCEHPRSGSKHIFRSTGPFHQNKFLFLLSLLFPGHPYSPVFAEVRQSPAMSKFFGNRHSSPRLDQSAFLLLLDPSDISAVHERPTGGRTSTPLADSHHATKLWLAAVEGRPSWIGERPPTRKLVKDMNGSGRPSFSLELSDSDTAEKDKGVVRRQLSRLRLLYRSEK